MKKISADVEKDKKIYIVYAGITIAALIFYLTHSNARWLNQDDLVSLHVITGKHSFAELMERNSQMGLQPPLAAIIFYLWAKIVPATVNFIKGPSIIAVTLAVYIVCCIGKKLRGNFTGAAAGILLAASNYSFMESVFSIRTYGIFVLFAALTFWYHLKIAEEWEQDAITVKTVILYGLSMALLFYSHYFGVLLAFGLGLTELVKIAAAWKKAKRKNMIMLLLPYAISVLLLLPYALSTMIKEYQSIGVTAMVWTTAPHITDLPVMVYYFFSNVVTFAVFIVLTLLLLWHMFRQKEKALWKTEVYVYLAVSAFYIGFAFIYSAYLKADGSFWVRRYFCSLMPAVYLVCAIALDYVREHYLKGKMQSLVYIWLVVVVLVNWYDIPFNTKENQKDEYRPVIEYLESQNVNEQKDTVIYSSWWGDAFNYFYTDNYRNDRTPAVLELQGDDVPEEINTVYVITAHISDWENRITDPEFELVETDADIPLVKYVRK